MDEAKANLAERLKNANNVLVTVSRNPSVDQLSALLGLGLFLNKEGKHCAAVFSGEIPSTLEFLKPASTIQKNTDSLRDFIIALDKSKADKLRYKVEDNVVRIFITPYKSSIGQDDLEFSQGDFNVDVVVALGVMEQTDLDEAITAHGRILHDATVASINVNGNGNLGAINWNDPAASSLSELVTELIEAINSDSIDEQIATALLTGVVATTNRFSNDKTSAKTMSVSSLLMSAGANQQLVATKLEEPVEPKKEEPQDGPTDEEPKEKKEKPEPGTLEIEHKTEAEEPKPEEQEHKDGLSLELPEPEEEPPIEKPEEPDPTPQAGLRGGTKLVTEPPILGGTLTANSQQNDMEPTTDPLSLAKSDKPALLDRKPDTSSRAPFKPLDNLAAPAPTPPQPTGGLPQLTPPPSDWTAPAAPAAVSPAPSIMPTQPEPPVMAAPAVEEAPAEPSPPVEDNSSDPALGQVHIDEDGNLSNINGDGTLAQIEESVHSPHLEGGDTDSADAARAAIDEAYGSGPDNSLPTPSPSLNAQPLGAELHSDSQAPPPVPPPFNPA